MASVLFRVPWGRQLTGSPPGVRWAGPASPAVQDHVAFFFGPATDPKLTWTAFRAAGSDIRAVTRFDARITDAARPGLGCSIQTEALETPCRLKLGSLTVPGSGTYQANWAADPDRSAVTLPDWLAGVVAAGGTPELSLTLIAPEPAGPKLYLGSTEVQGVYLGSTEVQGVYLGSTETSAIALGDSAVAGRNG